MPLLQTWSKLKQILSVFRERQYYHILLISTVTILLSSKGLTNEGIISFNGDMPRYMMNGVYFYDLIRDLPIHNFVQYTVHYFAKYPALSLGHHPILPGVALVPFYAIFGISVFSARLMIISFMLIAAIFWYLLIRLLYDKNVALLSSLLFVTTPYIVVNSRIVMSEIPCLAIIILTFYYLCRFCSSDEKKHMIGFAIASVASVYAKQTAIFIFPFYFLYFIITKGFKSLFKKDIIITSLIIILLILPLVPITLRFSNYNVSFSIKNQNIIYNKVFLEESGSGVYFRILKHYWNQHIYRILSYIWRYHLSKAVLVLSLISIGIGLYKRKKQDIIFLLWIITIFILFVYFGLPSPRHTFYWIPPFCLLATTIIAAFNNRQWKIIVSIIIILISGYQFNTSFKSSPEYFHGVEEAAKYVSTNWKGDSVLYNFHQDSGYFIFFLKKHSQNQNRIVLRSDKILATSKMSHIIEERIHTDKEIYNILDKFGVAYLVTLDKKTSVPAFEKLREEFDSPNFILRKRIPIQISRQTIKNLFFNIYEYKRYTKAQSDAVLSMNIPLINESIDVNFNDLLEGNQKIEHLNF